MAEQQPANNEPVPVLLVAYEDDADLEVDDSGPQPTVENHDELVDTGQTYEEIRILKRSDAEQYNLDVIEPGDRLWDEELEDMELGDSRRLDELRD